MNRSQHRQRAGRRPISLLVLSKGRNTTQPDLTVLALPIAPQAGLESSNCFLIRLSLEELE